MALDARLIGPPDPRQAPQRERYAAVARGLRRWVGSGRCVSEGGEVYAWIAADTGRPSFCYPEIGGYALTYISTQDELSPGERERGHAIARWLLGRLQRGRYEARDGWDGGAVYNFDLAMIGTGLMSFGELVDDEEVTSVGLSLARLIADTIATRGYLEPVNSRLGPSSSRLAWSSLGRAHLSKAVQVLLLADVISPEDGFADHAATLMHGSAAMQNLDGAFETNPGDPLLMLHPHLYSGEAFWIWGTARGDNVALARARGALEWALNHQLHSGGLPRARNCPEQSDVTAQAARLALLLGQEGPAITRALDRLCQVAHRSETGHAVIYQPTSGLLHQSSWATLFAAQTLDFASHPDRVITWRQLV